MQHSITLISELVIKYILKNQINVFKENNGWNKSFKKKGRVGDKEFDLDKDEASKLHVVEDRQKLIWNKQKVYLKFGWNLRYT